jgi:hypothetical protein
MFPRASSLVGKTEVTQVNKQSSNNLHKGNEHNVKIQNNEGRD